ncbi:MAG: bifunctional helix-turn-helix transcriptional regulator/GNAT family N-acetyltransferase [Acidobacteria bacterium]|nr:bifunctional helix-turn-helix transcriptional regulator/GNAT family N-acetyltransferase [Acidobacteriota bacterium]
METIRKLGILALGSRLKRLSDRLMQDAGLVYREAGLNFESRWFLIFYQLAESGPLSVTAIAEAVGITHPAVNQVAAEMEKAGLITSSADNRDRRRRILALSPRGRTLDAAIRPVWEDIETATQGLVQESGTDLLAAVEAVEDALARRSMLERIQRCTDERRAGSVRILDFEPRFRKYFGILNYQWLRKHFQVEDPDREVLENPEERVLAPGGRIFFAETGGRIVGTCALVRLGDRSFELSKMAVEEKFQRRGIGERLARHALAAARDLGAETVVLHTSLKLEAAVALYRKLGFEPVPLTDPTHFQRPTVRMAKRLNTASVND